MNREIKFRAWDSVHNRMIYSDKHLGFRPFEDNNSFDNYDFNISKKGVYCLAYDEYDDDFGGGVCNENYLPIMMWTGLKDKNGVDIYGGDLIEYKDSIGKHIEEVKFDKGCFYAGLHGGSSTRVSPKLINTRISKVIGNIYENEVSE